MTNVTFACEPLTADLLREAIPLLREHWAEVSHYADIPLDVDVDGYLIGAPAMRCYTVRASRWRGQEIEMIGFNPTTAVFRVVGYEGSNTCPVADIRHELVGYALFVVRPNLHYKQSLQASQDVIYLHPSVRGGTGARFIAWCDEQLRAEGVQVTYHHQKGAHPQLGLVLERQGYERVETVWAKRLDAAATLQHEAPETYEFVLVQDGGHTPEVSAGLRAQHAGAAHPWNAADATNDAARTGSDLLDFSESMQALAAAHE